MPYLPQNNNNEPKPINLGYKKYTILQKIEITCYPNGSVFPKTLWQKIEDVDVQQANQMIIKKKQKKAIDNKILEAKEKAEKKEKQEYKNNGVIEI